MSWKRKIFSNWNLTHPDLNAAQLLEKQLLIDAVNPEIGIQLKDKLPHDFYADKLLKEIV